MSLSAFMGAGIDAGVQQQAAHLTRAAVCGLLPADMLLSW
jgi:hypothetical protein